MVPAGCLERLHDNSIRWMYVRWGVVTWSWDTRGGPLTLLQQLLWEIIKSCETNHLGSSLCPFQGRLGPMLSLSPSS
jgi:hypothetical protein